MTDLVKPIRETHTCPDCSGHGLGVVGYWRTDAPLTPEQVDEDRPHLDQVSRHIPPTVTVRDLVVWVNGREYRWDRVETFR